MLTNPPVPFSIGKGFLSEVILMLIWLGLYSIFPFYEFYFLGFSDWGIREETFLIRYGLHLLLGLYVLSMPLTFSLYRPTGRWPKSLLLYEKLKARKFDAEFGQILLSFALKFQFIPLMYLGAIKFGDITLGYMLNFSDVLEKSESMVLFFNQWIFGFFVHAALTIVLIVYAFGYIIESEILGSQIKKIDRNPFSWMVTLVCYFPWFPIVAYIIPLGSQDFAFFKNQEITALVRCVLMLVILLKVWSIFVLGSKSSNLTNRGIVTGGPYKWIRHPHYFFKLIVWWIGIIPSGIGNSWLFAGMIFWTTIYVLRAMTEEDFLKEDIEYQQYMKKVKWRFIPGIF